MSDQWAVEKAREWLSAQHGGCSCVWEADVLSLSALLEDVAENARVIAQVGANREILEARAERDEQRQRADDCCRMGERTCAELVREREEARAEVARLREEVARLRLLESPYLRGGE
jgi:hypothetical protein